MVELFVNGKQFFHPIMADLKKLKLSSYCGVIKCFIVDDQGELSDERKKLLESLKISFGLTDKEHDVEMKNAQQDFFVKKAVKRKEEQKKDKEDEKKEEKTQEKSLQKAQSFAFPLKGNQDFRSMVLNKVDYNKINEEKKLKFGTPRHKNCKDKAFEKAGFTPGLKIWRIENFKVEAWPEKDYGSFYEGDSYLVLNTYKKDLDGFNMSLGWDVHFWLGKDSTRDETGTAALKAIELDDTLGGRAIQYREVQGHESSKFLSLFPNGRRLLSGGIDSGFNEVKPQEYKPRLFHIKGSKSKQKCDEVALSCDSLNEGDAFVLDAGLFVYIWEGKKSSRPEKMRATHVSNDIKSARKNVKIIREDNGSESKEFWEVLGGKTRVKSAEEGGDDEEVVTKMKNILFQLSDETGTMEFTKIKEGDLFYDDFKTEDVFIADVSEYIIVWIGNGTTEQERKSSLVYGQKYLDDNNKPDWIPLVKMIEGSESTLFWSYVKKPDSKSTTPSPLAKKVFGAFGKKETSSPSTLKSPTLKVTPVTKEEPKIVEKKEQPKVEENKEEVKEEPKVEEKKEEIKVEEKKEIKEEVEEPKVEEKEEIKVEKEEKKEEVKEEAKVEEKKEDVQEELKTEGEDELKTEEEDELEKAPETQPEIKEAKFEEKQETKVEEKQEIKEEPKEDTKFEEKLIEETKEVVENKQEEAPKDESSVEKGIEETKQESKQEEPIQKEVKEEPKVEEKIVNPKELNLLEVDSEDKPRKSIEEKRSARDLKRNERNKKKEEIEQISTQDTPSEEPKQNGNHPEQEIKKEEPLETKEKLLSILKDENDENSSKRQDFLNALVESDHEYDNLENKE